MGFSKAVVNDFILRERLITNACRVKPVLRDHLLTTTIANSSLPKCYEF